jgi:hypothetical protein
MSVRRKDARKTGSRISYKCLFLTQELSSHVKFPQTRNESLTKSHPWLCGKIVIKIGRVVEIHQKARRNSEVLSWRGEAVVRKCMGRSGNLGIYYQP